MTELPPITDEDRQFLHYNPNTADVVEWVRAYAQAAVLAEREVLTMAAHDAITRALTEAGVKQEVLRGMCIEVGLEAFGDAIRARGE